MRSAEGCERNVSGDTSWVHTSPPPTFVVVGVKDVDGEVYWVRCEERWR